MIYPRVLLQPESERLPANALSERALGCGRNSLSDVACFTLLSCHRTLLGAGVYAEGRGRPADEDTRHDGCAEMPKDQQM